MAITILTGALIALFTFGIMFMISSDVRTAIFGLDNLKKMISERSKELEKIKSDKATLLSEIDSMQKTLDNSKKEISILSASRDNLSKEIKTARSGNMLFKVNDVMTSSVIETGSDREQIKDKLTALLSSTDSIIKKLAGNARKHYLVMAAKEMDEAVDYAASHPGSTIVRIVSARNVLFGELVPVHFELFENVLVFKKGDIVTNAIINGSKSVPEIEQKIKEALAKVNEIAIRKGMVPGPDGSIGVIPYSRIFEVSKIIRTRNKTITIRVEVQKDSYSSGPLEVDIRIAD